MKRAGARRIAGLLGAACIALQLAGCSLPKLPNSLDFSNSKVGWDKVTLTAANNANRNSPVAVDIVFITDNAVVEKLIDLTSAKWFSSRADLAKTYPKVLTYKSWELVPGQVLNIETSTLEAPRVAAALVFADYATPGSHRVRIEEFKNRLVVRMDADDFTVSTAP
jgi:type VI secretion system protein